jgi:hypothetical protein
LIAKLIKATPEKSDRQIAETVKASPTTVGTVRAKMEAKGDVSKLDTRADSKGRQQPVKRKPKPTEADLEAWDAGEISRAEAERRGINTRPATKPVHTRRGAAAHVCWQCGRRGKVGEVQQRHYACYEDADVWLHDACVSAFDQDEQRREQQREAAAKRIHALMGGETEPHDDTGSANNGENARLRARNEELENENQRLQRENIALRSEIEELRAQLPPGNPGPVPASLRRAAP